MRLKQFAKPGPRGEVHERNQRWHLKIGVDVSFEADRIKGRIKGDGAEEEMKDGTYWRKGLTVGQIVQSLVTSQGIRYEPVARDPSTVRSRLASLFLRPVPSLPSPPSFQSDSSSPFPSSLSIQLIHLLHVSSTSLSTLSLLLDPSSQISACVEDGAEVWLVKGDGWRVALASSLSP